MNCHECVKSLYPDDPRVASGKYGYTGCDYCDKPMSDRLAAEPRLVKPLADDLAVKQIPYLLEEINYLKNQVNWLKISKAKADKDTVPQLTAGYAGELVRKGKDRL